MKLSTLHRRVAILLATLWAGVCLALPAPHDIEQKTPAPHAAPVAVAAAAAPQTAEPARPAWWWPAVLSAGFALLVLALWRRMAARTAPHSGLQPTGSGMGAYASEAPRGFGAQYDPRGPAAAYGTPYPAAGYPAPSAPSPGSGVAGAVVGGLAGVAAGYALSRALEGHNASPTDNHQLTNRPADPMEDIGLVRMNDAAQDSGLGSFDGSAGDDWGPSDDDSSW